MVRPQVWIYLILSSHKFWTSSSIFMVCLLERSSFRGSHIVNIIVMGQFKVGMLSVWKFFLAVSSEKIEDFVTNCSLYTKVG